MRPFNYDAFTSTLPSPYAPAPSAKRVAADVVASIAIAIGLAIIAPACGIALWVAIFVP